ncbi:Predicted DNA-binding transcriptional regulator YafY, contains an HTH and WYL domains [Marinobacter daqiaonensis]|uniref:Predicted DNA-binding transcriptional regulator YafY, contains an HTH and WYL domains n=1 Tax=Marinobacter daqiaonensis TaxID=650891 RepID=A0A1I6IHG6_9GAMM|nr:WYL domain-containing protein [Marinobacter daqiaonensis]SFR66133.1 Predicted DNA-binding transcriptional regulator YafY, contains an HTH and WYL domains [Marinobacter daqiaonensis]
MKKTEWPIRWDLLLRYRLIEIVALWEGRLTTNHICHGFGIGRQQASKDINTYLRELAPGNLVYDRHLKGYIPAPDFQPVVTRGEPQEYLELACRHQALSQCFENLDIGLPDSCVVRAPCRQASPEVTRSVITACRQKRKLDIRYLTLDNPDGESLLLEPHTLVLTGQGWHVRAWSDKREGFGDYRLSRIAGKMQVCREKSRHREEHDERWNRMISLRLQPTSGLNAAQRKLVCADFGLEDGPMEVRAREAILPWLLPMLGLDSGGREGEIPGTPLELVNGEALPAWLKRSTRQQTATHADTI